MNKNLVNLICSFIPSKEKRHNFRNKYLSNNNISNNNIINDTLKLLQNNDLTNNNDKNIIFNNFLNFNYDENFIINELKKIEPFYFYPNNGNLGDILIAEAEFQFFARNNLNYQVFNPDEIPNEKFNLVYGGGGLFVKYWGYKKQITVFKNKNIQNIILLSSSFFECDDLLNIFDERFTVLCREQKSFDYVVSKKTKANIYLNHDMVFYLKNNNINNFNNNKTILLSNCENYINSIYDNLYLAYIKVYQNTIQMLNNITEINGFKVGFFIRTDVESNTKWNEDIKSTIDLSLCGCGTAFDYGLTHLLSNIFLSAIDSVDIIVSDRLHIGIGATLLAKETFLIDNSYGKVSNVYKNSMLNITTTHLINNTNDILKEINKSINNNVKKTGNIKNLLKCNLTFIEFIEKYISIINNFDFIITKTIW